MTVEGGSRSTGDEATLREAVGPNADYYLARWQEMRARGSKISWNWPACLLNLYWFAWRKMWGPLALLILAFLVLAVAGAAGPRAGQLTLLASIGLSFVTGAYGNYLYRRHVERVVTSAPQTETDGLRRQGGTSNLALGIAIGLTLILGALAVAGLMADARA